MVEKLVDACRDLNDIFWRQSDRAGLALYKSTRDPQLKRLLGIMGSRWDLIDEDRPFVGKETAPPGRELYPHDLTRARLDAYLKAHPEDREAIYNPYTVVKWRGDRLIGVPYHEEYREFLEPAAKALREAASLSADPAFAKFLQLRAEALLTDNYYPSAVAWLDLKDPKFDVIFAADETYSDGLLGVKTSYGAAVLIRNGGESDKLALYQKYVPEIQDALPLPAADRPSKRGHLTPMEVMDAPYRAGDLRYGYQAVADNLPNDPRIHEEKGTKKVFFKNFMDARVDYVILPVARKLMDAGPGGESHGRRVHGGGDYARDLPWAGSGVRPPRGEADGHQRGDRAGLFRAGRGEGGCGGDVRPGVADGSRRATEGAQSGILRVVCGRHLPHFALRHGGGARARRDDGVQLPAGERRDRNSRAGATAWTTRAFRARSRRWQKNCSRRKRPAIARAPRRGSRSTTRCRRN